MKRSLKSIFNAKETYTYDSCFKIGFNCEYCWIASFSLNILSMPKFYIQFSPRNYHACGAHWNTGNLRLPYTLYLSIYISIYKYNWNIKKSNKYQGFFSILFPEFCWDLWPAQRPCATEQHCEDRGPTSALRTEQASHQALHLQR